MITGVDWGKIDQVRDIDQAWDEEFCTIEIGITKETISHIRTKLNSDPVWRDCVSYIDWENIQTIVWMGEDLNIRYPNRTVYRRNGQLHRGGGPADVFDDGRELYFLNGKGYLKSEYWKNYLSGFQWYKDAENEIFDINLINDHVIMVSYDDRVEYRSVFSGAQAEPITKDLEKFLRKRTKICLEDKPIKKIEFHNKKIVCVFHEDWWYTFNIFTGAQLNIGYRGMDMLSFPDLSSNSEKENFLNLLRSRIEKITSGIDSPNQPKSEVKEAGQRIIIQQMLKLIKQFGYTGEVATYLLGYLTKDLQKDWSKELRVEILSQIQNSLADIILDSFRDLKEDLREDLLVCERGEPGRIIKDS